jgi:hypothetical protein
MGKSQYTNHKSKTIYNDQMTKIPNLTHKIFYFGHCNLFGIWNLEFGIFQQFLWHIACCFFFIYFFVLQVEAAPIVASEELLKNAEKYEGKTIVFEGEAIGDIFKQGQFSWVNVRDATAGIGVFCPQKIINKIKYTGSYKFSGDIISVRGVFHRSCIQHGGDTDIHAQRLIVVQKGAAVSHPLEPQKIQASIILPAVAFILIIIHLILKRFR